MTQLDETAKPVPVVEKPGPAAATAIRDQNQDPCDPVGGTGRTDVQELAERVYALLKRELVIERERLGRR